MGSYAQNSGNGRKTEQKKASFGETPREYIARKLQEPDTRLIPGRVYVGPIQISKDGNEYRIVTVSFKDALGEDCRVKKIWYEGQVYHADDFIPYHDHSALVCVVRLNEVEVETEPKKRGPGQIYIYKCDNLFLSNLNALRSQDGAIAPPDLPAFPNPGWSKDLPPGVLPNLEESADFIDCSDL